MNYTPLNEIRHLMDPEYVQTNKINCIKYLRSITGEGLKETKDFFEAEWLPFVIHGQRNVTKPIASLMQEDAIRELEKRVDQLESQISALLPNPAKEMAKGIFE